MTTSGRTTLTQFVLEEQWHGAQPDPDLAAIINDVALACKIMATTVSHWPLATGPQENAGAAPGDTGSSAPNAKQILLRAKEWSGHLGNTMWRGGRDLFRGVSRHPHGDYALAFEPIDRWSNLDINVPVGSIFSILRSPGGEPGAAGLPQLPLGRQQLCAGYAIYGPSTKLVLATESGVNGFTLDHDVGEFVLTRPRLSIAPEAQEFCINTSTSRYWGSAIKRYVDECVAGPAGARGREFNMRWSGSLVTELHRTLIRGGVCLYPRDPEGRNDSRCPRLVYDACPAAFIVERAGGRASTGKERVLDLEAASLDQRVGLIFGARAEVDLIERYHRESAQGDYSSPLFNTRGLFQTGAT